MVSWVLYSSNHSKLNMFRVVDKNKTFEGVI